MTALEPLLEDSRATASPRTAVRPDSPDLPAVTPRVSIAIPVYNGAETIRGTLESALEQSFEDFEVVVVDNASTDGTADIVAAYDDPRIRLHVNATNLGFLPNHNLSFSRSRGEFIKPLHADDRLLPTCLEEMLALFDEAPSVGMVFAPRIIELADESDPDLQAWRDEYERAHENFAGLQRINDGRVMLEQVLASDVARNWVGEPSSVMIRRSAIARIGLYSPHVHAFNDLDMVVRLLALYDIGFVEEPQSVYLRSWESNIQALRRKDWLDRVWLLEGLAADREAVERNPGIAPALRRAQVRAGRMLLRTARRQPELLGTRLRDVGRYARYRAKLASGHAPALHPRFED